MFTVTQTLPNKPSTHIIFAPLLTAAVIFCYYDIFLWMIGRFDSADSYYSHGYLVPFVFAYLIWEKREIFHKIRPKASLIGFFLVVAALALHLFGTVIYVFSISGFSLFFLVIGIFLFLFGMDTVKKIWFPLFFLIFMFPLPLAILNAISFPLKNLVAKISAQVISLMGIPIYREGFTIFIPTGSLLVGNPCSGLRTLVAFLAVGSLLAYISHVSTPKKCFLFALSVPIAILANFVRVPILILVSHYYSLEAAAPDTLVHTGSGFLVFILGFGLMILCSQILTNHENKI